MKDTFVQHKLISIPQTSGTRVYSFLFKADDCYQYLSGVACFALGSNTPSADDIKIEFRSDYKPVLSFSPYVNWVKNPQSASFNMQDVFKPLCLDARGRNFYLNVKVTNCNAFSFMALVKQTTTPLQCIRYDAQSWDIVAPALTQAFEITLPSDYDKCKGVMLTGGQAANSNVIGFDIFDSAGQIVDPLPVSILTPSVDTNIDCGFYPIDFDSKAKQISVRLTALGDLVTDYVATTYTVTFLLTDENND